MEKNDTRGRLSKKLVLGLVNVSKLDIYGNAMVMVCIAEGDFERNKTQ